MTDSCDKLTSHLIETNAHVAATLRSLQEVKTHPPNITHPFNITHPLDMTNPLNMTNFLM